MSSTPICSWGLGEQNTEHLLQNCPENREQGRNTGQLRSHESEAVYNQRKTSNNRMIQHGNRFGCVFNIMRTQAEEKVRSNFDKAMAMIG